MMFAYWWITGLTKGGWVVVVVWWEDGKMPGWEETSSKHPKNIDTKKKDWKWCQTMILRVMNWISFSYSQISQRQGQRESHSKTSIKSPKVARNGTCKSFAPEIWYVRKRFISGLHII